METREKRYEERAQQSFELGMPASLSLWRHVRTLTVRGMLCAHRFSGGPPRNFRISKVVLGEFGMKFGFEGRIFFCAFMF